MCAHARHERFASQHLSESLPPKFGFLAQYSIKKHWKNANISPIHKKGDRTQASNYRLVSLTSVSCKLCEHIIHSHIMEFLDKHKILTTSQHGFRSGHSWETQLIQAIHDFTSALDNKTQTDVVIMDFSKAFNTVPHNRLLLNVLNTGLMEGSMIGCLHF